ncbi:MAG: GNAT family N-acetyltransferase [Oscillospiraceae bacterium]|nr:GNAT family N-acetyltransferase [Oscillospiraceae bacterium]
MELSEIRPQIDEINKQMLELFQKRMALCREVALYKQEHDMEVFVPAREAAIMQWADTAAEPALRPYVAAFFNTILQLSRDYQNASLGRPAEGSAMVGGTALYTRRLQLLPLNQGDVPPVFSLTSNPEVARYMKFEAHTSPRETEDLIREYTEGNNYACKVLLKDSCEFVGVFAIKVDKSDPEKASVSAFFSPDHWGKGYLAELLELARIKGRELTGAKALWAYIVSENERSNRAVLSAGYQLDSTFRFGDMEESINVYRLELD